jgi:hypothetical protein
VEASRNQVQATATVLAFTRVQINHFLLEVEEIFEKVFLAERVQVYQRVHGLREVGRVVPHFCPEPSVPGESIHVTVDRVCYYLVFLLTVVNQPSPSGVVDPRLVLGIQLGEVRSHVLEQIF